MAVCKTACQHDVSPEPGKAGGWPRVLLTPIERDPDATIDGLVERRMREMGVEASPLVSCRTLIRRLSYDLTGLPLDPTRVEQFVADGSPEAYRIQLDECLESVAFGTHCARLWLDQVRLDAVDGSQPYRQCVVDELKTPTRSPKAIR